MTNKKYHKHDETNRLIAEFMGLETVVRHPRTGEWAPAHFDFHHSWDCLMSVVEKICEIEDGDFDVIISYGHTTIAGYEKYPDLHIYSDTDDKMITHVYNVVTSFIKWYNQTTLDNAREEDISDWE